MAVSYNLDVKNFQSLDVLSQAIIGAPFSKGLFDNFRFWNPNKPPEYPDLFPTGEYIIRKGMYINGSYVFVGSYRAYCVDLFGAGNNGYAWDGFIMVIRAYSVQKFPPIVQIPGEEFPAAFPDGFGFLPMRMMYEVNPGGIGDATAISNDSSVGLYGLDVFKSLGDITVTTEDPNIRIITCGKQRINASVENAPTGMDYVGNIYMGVLLQFMGSDEEQVSYEGREIFRAMVPGGGTNFMQITWRANDPNHIDKTSGDGWFNRAYNLEDYVAVVEGVNKGGGPIWDFERWELGNTPPTESIATEVNVFPRSFLDITCVSEQPVSFTTQAGSPFLIVGEASIDSNNDGTADKKVPMAMGCAYPFPAFLEGILTAPYMNMNPAIATSLSQEPTLRWSYDGDAPAYDLENAQAVFCSQPYEAISSQPPFLPDFFPQTLIAINNIDFSGTTYGAIYTTEGTFIQPRFEVIPLAVHNGAFATATGIDLPTKFYAKAVQQRTFTIPEEDIAKQGQLSLETGEFVPNVGGESFTPAVFDSDSQEYIGFISNYQRYGAFDLSDPSVTVDVEAGDLTGSGYGFLGILDGVGPSAIMFDSGSPKLIENPPQPLSQSIVVRQEGGNLNANTISNPTSTTRKMVNCGWDNDRDQWLFIGSDTNDVSVLSVSSDFSTASNNIGFLDQTSSFGELNSGTDAGFYFPISMSNALDGWVWFGAFDDGLIGGIKPASLGASSSYTYTFQDLTTVTYDIYRNATTEIVRITGTSGRTARVWVDYVLFDGPDALIANKLKERGMKVSIEAVEWFKRQIIQTGDLNITAEEIEMWMRDQQDEYKQTLKEIERQGRLRRRKKQVSAYLEGGIEEQINPDFMDTEVKDFVDTFTPETRPPTPEEARIEKKKKGGYSPEQDSYYDEVFED
jgi:hypothetical protein